MEIQLLRLLLYSQDGLVWQLNEDYVDLNWMREIIIACYTCQVKKKYVYKKLSFLELISM